MSYPPYSKIVLITFKGSDYDDNRVAAVIKRLVEDNKELEILRPSVSMSRKGLKEHPMLIKTASKTKLYSSAKEFLKLAEGCKNLKISIAVDP